MGRKKITIEDIAREANVGIGTVSRVLNNSSHVAEETRKKVLDVVKARQYSPSGAASRLARNDAIESTVGLLLPDIGNHYFFEIFEAIYRKFRGLGVDLLIFNYEKHNPQFIQKVLDAQLSALLIFAFQLDETERELLRRRNVPYLYIDYSRADEHCMYTDNEQGGRLAARYLLSKGVKHPGYIAMDPPGQPMLTGIQDLPVSLHSMAIRSVHCTTLRYQKKWGTRSVCKSSMSRPVTASSATVMISQWECTGLYAREEVPFT
jgi:DNA-binding LacI/PurR family transcriptional regulator